MPSLLSALLLYVEKHTSKTSTLGKKKDPNAQSRAFVQMQVPVFHALHCSTSVVGQVKFPNFLNTAPQILYMVDLVRVNAKKIDLKATNQLLFGLLRFISGKIIVLTKRFDQP